MFDDVLFYSPARAVSNHLATFISLTKQLRRLAPRRVVALAPSRTHFQQVRDRFFFRCVIGVGDYTAAPAAADSLRDQPNHAGEPEWRRLLRTVEPDGNTSAFRFQIPMAAKREVAAAVAAESLSAADILLAIGPGSKMPAKRWPRERYQELGARLLADIPHLHLLILGGPEDAGLGSELCVGWGDRGHNLAGRLSVYGAAAMAQRCRGFVGNDTGTMHLAAMAGTPCVALFSARDVPGRWAPFGAGHVILRRQTECSGCMLTVCAKEQNKCLKLIQVDDVYNAIHSWLK